MSFIETAIRRMRESATAAPPPPPPGPTVVAAAVPVAPVVAEAPPVPPRRRLEIDIAGLRATGLLPAQSEERQIARQYRRIKLPLVARALGAEREATPDGNILMVASALPGEGKSFSSVNLAFSLAREREVEVVLVDADVAKPHLSHAFGASGDPGLMDALTDESIPLESLVLPTNVPRLNFLPAGRFDESSATELLGSTRMKDVVRLLGSLRRRLIVVFDSPPVLLTTEAEVLATLVGQIVLIVRSGVTRRSAVLDAVARLPEDKPIGLILNQARIQLTDEYSYYAGYGNYGSYGGHATGSGGSSQTPESGGSA